MASPSVRIGELETLLARVRRANACLSNYDMWSDRGRSFATDEEIATMDAEAGVARRELAEAKAALEALVATTRIDAPHEIAAWVAAHDLYLAEFVGRWRERGTATPFAVEARARWAEVLDGRRDYVDDTGGMTEEDPATADRFRALFGIDPKTLQPV